MATLDLNHPSQVLNLEIAATRRFFENIGSRLSRFGHAFAQLSLGHRRLQMVEQLQARSDAELAAMKLKREDIVPYVFRDLYYL